MEVIVVPFRNEFISRKGLKGYNYDYIEQIVENKRRNQKIVDLVEKQWKKKKYIIVLVQRVKHLKILSKLLGHRPHALVYGAVKGNVRLEKIGEFDKGDFRLIIANIVFTKGVDIKRVDVGIDAAALKNENDCLQKYGRLVRLHKDKKKIKYYDLSDRGNRFEKAALKRIRVFKKSKIEVQDDTKGKELRHE